MWECGSFEIAYEDSQEARAEVRFFIKVSETYTREKSQTANWAKAFEKKRISFDFDKKWIQLRL